MTDDSLKIFMRAMQGISSATGRPLLYGPNGKPLAPSASLSFRRDAAKKTGSLKNWTPQRLYSNQAEASDRLAIVERSISLAENDPHAAGIIDTFASTVIGAGLQPLPMLDPDLLDMDKEDLRKIMIQQKAVLEEWSPHADAGGRMSWGQIQYMMKLQQLKYGEYFMLLPMIKDQARPFSLACQFISPLRVKTPSDKVNDGNIKDGIELDAYGAPRAVWIKKNDPRKNTNNASDNSQNFLRIPYRRGHRLNILHGFVCRDADQVRGIPFFAPAMKYFRDFNDLLNAELVSNVVTAALAYFIEVSDGSDPYDMAYSFGTQTDTVQDDQGRQKSVRYQEAYPGQIMYGNTGEKPHLLSANRPGTTFEPFVRAIKKSLALSVNMPYPVLFKDVEGVNYAGFRSAMLDAWRVFSMERKWHGECFCQPVWRMLQEEAVLRGRYRVRNFYSRMWAVTRCEWRGAPKGDIEPIKQVQADILAVQNHIKTRSAVIAEREGGDFRETVEQLADEKDLLEEKGLFADSDLAAMTTTNEEQQNGTD